MPNNRAKIAAISIYLLLTLFTLQSAPALAVEDPSPASRNAEAIIGGTYSIFGAQPWMAALYYKSTSAGSKVSDRNFCGGALVDAGWVVTAAHCVTGTSAASFSVVVGRDNLDATSGETFDVSEIILHPYWGSDSLYDIAMLRLKGSAKTLPVQRSTAAIDDTLVGSTLIVRGWGYSNYVGSYNCQLNFIDFISKPQDFSCQTVIYRHGTSPKDLIEAKVRVASYSECSARYRAWETSIGKKPPTQDLFDSVYTPEEICAWDPADKQATCFGDSGGPLTAVVNGTTVLVGLLQGGYVDYCGASLEIGLFSRVSYHKYFIDEVMTRTQSLEFSALCPGGQTLSLAYEAQGGGKTKVKVSWAIDDKAIGYRLFYASKDSPSPGAGIAKMELPATSLQIAVVLASGQRFNVAMQSMGAACDGPVSAMNEVIVP